MRRDNILSKPKYQIDSALVVGKFCPLHLGHELLIRTAISKSRQVYVLSYSKPEFEKCDPEKRTNWLTARFPNVIQLVLDDEILKQEAKKQDINSFPQIPDNCAHDDEHRLFVAWVCQVLWQVQVDAVFTSEDYGDGFAEVLTEYFSENGSHKKSVIHVCVDKTREQVPVSGTEIRKNPTINRHFLSQAVYADFVERICILGGESTGKTTLAEKLADSLNTIWVPEYGRELWEEQNGELAYNDMLEIAKTQIAKEEKCLPQAKGWLICDTSPLTTLFYSLELFRRSDPILEELADRQYSHVFLCAPDFEFIQDGTRKGDEFRKKQHRWYLSELKTRDIPFTILNGSVGNRVKRVTSILA